MANDDVGTSGCRGLVLEPGDAAGMAVVAVELGEKLGDKNDHIAELKSAQQSSITSATTDVEVDRRNNFVITLR